MDGKISYEVGLERLCKNYINLKLPSFFPRYRRAKRIASEGKVSILQLANSANTRNIFIVENGRGDKFAVITSRKFRNAYCTCKDFQLRSVVRRSKTPCKHILASMIVLNQMKAKKLKGWQRCI